MRRRQFITLIGAAAAAWPPAARAQQSDRVRRIGALTAGLGPADDPAQQSRWAAFQQALQQLGWTDGSNVRIDHRWGAGNADDIHKYAAELVALAPDLIVATCDTVERLLQVTRAVPIIFVIVLDPVGSGIVESLSRPGGNATGFMQFEYSLFVREMAGAAQRDRAGRRPSGGPSGPCHHRWDWPVRRHPVRGAVGPRRGEPDQPARRWRD
jgi:putative tryptophan/tyrosine transport system substrate-binding protein